VVINPEVGWVVRLSGRTTTGVSRGCFLRTPPDYQDLSKLYAQQRMPLNYAQPEKFRLGPAELPEEDTVLLRLQKRCDSGSRSRRIAQFGTSVMASPWRVWCPRTSGGIQTRTGGLHPGRAYGLGSDEGD